MKFGFGVLLSQRCKSDFLYRGKWKFSCDQIAAYAPPALTEHCIYYSESREWCLKLHGKMGFKKGLMERRELASKSFVGSSSTLKEQQRRKERDIWVGRSLSGEEHNEAA